MADLRVVPDDDMPVDDGDRWCLHCMATVVWQAVSERWVHEQGVNPRCHPLDPTDGSVAEPAPEGVRGVQRARFGDDDSAGRGPHVPRVRPYPPGWIS